jgi:hypothetical protein
VPTLSRRALPWLAAAALLVPLAGCGGSSSSGGSDGGGSSTGDTAAAVSDGDGGDGGGGGDLPDGCKKQIGPTVCFTYELTGAVTATGTSSGLVATGNGTDYETCADWTKGEPDGDDGQPSLSMPQGSQYQQGDKFGGLTGNIIEHYHGPGTYQKKDLSGQGSPSGVITPSSTLNFVLVDDSTGTATVNADGSGKFTFTNMGTGQYGHPETLSGTVGWTCHNP